jgi:hypothetical protein
MSIMKSFQPDAAIIGTGVYESNGDVPLNYSGATSGFMQFLAQGSPATLTFGRKADDETKQQHTGTT